MGVPVEEVAVAPLGILQRRRALAKTPHHVVERLRQDAELVGADLPDPVREIPLRDADRAEEKSIHGA